MPDAVDADVLRDVLPRPRVEVEEAAGVERRVDAAQLDVRARRRAVRRARSAAATGRPAGRAWLPAAVK